MEALEQYWSAVQDRVCVNCIDSDGHGNCRLSGEEECGLKVHFSKMVETVLSVQSDRLEPYVDALRNNVCLSCRHQSPDGFCMIRSHLDCGLDRYFPLVVEVIEDVRSTVRVTPKASGD